MDTVVITPPEPPAPPQPPMPPEANTTVTVATASRNDEPPSFGPDGLHGFHGWMVLIGLAILAGVIKTAIRAKHGLPSPREARRGEAPMPAQRAAELMASENETLKKQVGRLEERIAVLERIVTDPGRRVAAEIDALR